MALVFVVVAVPSLLLASVLALNTSRGRAFIIDRVNEALAEAIAGRIELLAVDWVDFAGARGVDARVFDPDGGLVIDAQGLDARLNVPRLVWALLIEQPDPLVVRIDHVSLRHTEVVLRHDVTKTPTIVTTFRPRTPSPPGATPGRGVSVVIDHIELEHAWVHGKLSGLPALDGEVKGVQAGFHDDAAGTHLRVESANATLRSLPGAIAAKGRVSGRLRVPKTSAPLDTAATFRGELAGAPIDAELKALGASVYGTVELGPIEPAALSRFAPGLAPKSSLLLSAQVQGKLPELAFEARVNGRAGLAHMNGVATLAEDTALRARVVAERLDLFELLDGAPRTEIGLVARISLMAPAEGGVSGDYDIALAPSKLAGFALPPIMVKGTLEHEPESGTTHASGRATIEEAGATTRVDVSFVTKERATLELKSRTVLDNAPLLERTLALGAVGVLEASAYHELGSGSFEASARLTLESLRRQPVSAKDLALTAHASGKLGAPLLSVSAKTGAASILGRAFSSTHLGLRGTPERLSVSAVLIGADATRVQLATTVTARGSELSLLGSKVSLSRSRTSVSAEARAIQLGAGRVDIDRLIVSGAGSAELSLSFGKRLERLELTTENLDLAALGRLVDPRLPLRRGRATLEGRFARDPEPELRVQGQIVDVYVSKIAGASLATDLTIHSGRASGALWARLAKGGDIVATLDEVGPINLPLSRATLRNLVGTVAIEGDLDLSYLTPLVPRALLPTEQASGRASFDIRLARASRASALPDLAAHLQTRALNLVGKRGGGGGRIVTTAQARRAQPWALREVDLRADVLLDGESGDTTFSVTAADRAGELLAVSMNTTLDPSLVRAPTSWPRAIWTSAFDLRVRVPKREIASLPGLIRPSNTRGVLDLNLQASGTLRDPNVKLAARIDAYGSLDGPEKKDALPLNLRIMGEQAAGRGTLTAEALTRERSVALLRSRWQGQPASMLDGDPPTLSALLELNQFPLGSLPALQTRSIAGTTSGEIRLQGLGKDAALEARLSTEKLEVEGAQLDSLVTSVRARDDQLQIRAKFVEPKGSAELSIDSVLNWGKRLTPELSTPARASAVAKNFRVAVISPLVSDFATELDGRLDADVKAEFGTDEPQIEGALELRGGAINVGVVGQRFHSIAARILLKPGELRVEQLRAKGTSGRLEGTGLARFHGLALERAEAHVRIPRTSPLPLTLEGVSYGDAWGRVNLALVNPEKGPLHTIVEVPQLHVDLPRSVGAEVQDLDPAEHIKIGVQKSYGLFSQLPLQPLEEEPEGERRPMLVDVKLGKDVWIRKGTQVSVQVTGATSIGLGEQTKLSGQIRLTGGRLDVSGKTFEIDRGTVTFDEDDPTNPEIFATARWDAPDGEYRVFAEYIGRLKNGKLLLRSEPSLSQDQILSLILFGSAEGQFGTSQESEESDSPAAAAIGVAGGVATQGLTRALSDITDLDVSARIDTSQGAGRPEIAVQVSPRIAAKVSYSVGEPSAGQSPDRTFFSLEFRLKGNLGVSTTVGDKGASSIELVWRKRY